MLFPSVNRQKAWLGFLLVVVLSANVYFHFTFEGTLQDRANWLDNLFSRLLIPFERTFSWSQRQVQDSGGSIFRMYHADRDNQELRKKIDEQALKIQELDEARSENSRLRELLEFRGKEKHNFIAAKVIARDPSLLFRSVEIDQGEEDGVLNAMAVVSPQGVVGRVIRTFNTSSTVLLVTDVNSRIEAVVQRSRTRSIVGGSPEGELTMRFLPRRYDMRQGDELVTSGIGGFFPPGFKIGTVVGMAQDPNYVLQEAQLEPAADFDSLSEVFVIRNKSTKE